jgi:ribosomal protein S18 acetylase RimI-like enzyme
MSANHIDTPEEAWEIVDPGAIQAYAINDGPISPLPVAGIHFAFVQSAQEAGLAAAMHEPYALVRARRDEGNQAVLALTDAGRIAGYGWIRHGAIQIDDLPFRLTLPRDHAYIWDCLTTPELRGRGIFPALLRFMLEALRREGVRHVWAGVAPGNDPSLHAFARADFRVVAHIGLVHDRLRIRALPAARPDEVAILTGRAG